MNISDVEVNTTSGSGETPIKLAYNILNLSIQIILMAAMGCVTTKEEILKHVKKPIGMGIAILSQFVALPAFTFGMVTLLNMAPYISYSALILACTPGGTLSNLITYMSKGDVSLSIILTTTSTVLAIGFMPLNLWLYTSSLSKHTIQVPYTSIAITLVSILIPMSIGMFMRVKIPKIAAIITKIGSALGLLIILNNIVLQNFVFPGSLDQHWFGWIAAGSIACGGFFLGYILAWVFRQPPYICRTIAVETGMQNVSLVLAIVIVSFP